MSNVWSDHCGQVGPMKARKDYLGLEDTKIGNPRPRSNRQDAINAKLKKSTKKVLGRAPESAYLPINPSLDAKGLVI